MPSLQRLPKSSVARSFSTPLTAGFNYAGAMVPLLVVQNHRGECRLKPGVDPTKAAAKRVWTFKDNEYILVSLNKWLGVHNSYPFLYAFLGIGLGVVNTPAGILWSVFSATLDTARASISTQCFARAADQLWMIEAVGLDGGVPKHMRQIWVVDPLRNGNSGPPASSWCIAEDRIDLEL